MESLRQILQKLGTNRQQGLKNDGTECDESDPTSLPPKCLICKDSLWVSRAVPFDHPDFGQAFPCRCSQNTEGAQQRLERYARLPRHAPPLTFKNFDVKAGNMLALSRARDFATRKSESHLLTLSGKHGTGKSHLLEAIGRVMLAEGAAVKYAYAPAILDALRASYGGDAPDGAFEAVYGRYSAAEVLLLDDVGAVRGTDWAVEQLTKLVDERYRDGRWMAVATDLGDKEMVARLGSRIADRLFDTGSGSVDVVYLTCPSYRTG
jgi:DNA replication protein DnaC